MRVFITGASSGIGAALARRFDQPGYHLTLLARRQERLEEVVKTLQHASSTLLVYDVVKDSAFLSSYLREHEYDVFINNAGLALGIEAFHKTPLEDLHQMIATNTTALVSLTHAVLQRMVARNQGYIVNIGSVAGSYAYSGAHVYGATKAFLEHFSRNLRCDLVGTGVRVTNIEPGMVETEFSQVRFKQDLPRAQAVYQDTIPLEAEDVAEVIYFCTHLPPHVNVSRLEVMSICQAIAGKIHKTA